MAVSAQQAQAEVLTGIQGDTLLAWLVPLLLGARSDNDLCFARGSPSDMTSPPIPAMMETASSTRM